MSRWRNWQTRIDGHPLGGYDQQMPNERHRSPWFDQSGYRACTVYYDDSTQKTVYEHREVMEAYLGRSLGRNELVHHKDKNRANNVLTNLEVKPRSVHASEHAHEDRPPEMVVLVCVACGARFARLARLERHNRKQGKTGPFCGKSCAARWARTSGLTGRAMFR